MRAAIGAFTSATNSNHARGGENFAVNVAAALHGTPSRALTERTYLQTYPLELHSLHSALFPHLPAMPEYATPEFKYA